LPKSEAPVVPCEVDFDSLILTPLIFHLLHLLYIVPEQNLIVVRFGTAIGTICSRYWPSALLP
jgi:hypothetical protein